MAGKTRVLSLRTGTSVEADPTFDLRRRRRPGEMVVQGFLFFCAAVSVLTTLGIVVVLLEEVLVFFRKPSVNLVEFLTTTSWQPKIGHFGIFPLLLAMVLTSVIGMLVALPVGLAIAIYLRNKRCASVV